MNAPLPESVRKALETVTLDDKKSGRVSFSLANVHSAKLVLTDKLIAATRPLDTSGVDEILDFGFLAHVDRAAKQALRRQAEVGRLRGQFVAAQVGEREIGAFLRKAARGGESEAGRRRRDDDRSPCELRHAALPVALVIVLANARQRH